MMNTIQFKEEYSINEIQNSNRSYDCAKETSINSTDIDLFDYETINKLKEESKINNFSTENILKSRHHSHTSNQKSPFHSYIYTNTNTILNKFIMSFEEQLHKAILKGNYELCVEILKKKCDLTKSYDHKLPLCIACEYNQYEIAELLIKYGADLNQFDYYEQNCLIYACDTGDLNLIKLLVENGADIKKCESNGAYPLHVAINRKNDEICDYLIYQGVEINAIDKMGCTPLALAINNDYLYMINKLLLLGADPNQVDNNGDTPLIKSIWLSMNSSFKNDEIFYLVKRLVECGADINAKNESGRTALFTAIYQNNTEIALYLIEKGAKCVLEESLLSNFTLVHYACFQGNYKLTKVLLEKGCDPNSIATSCESPVYIAVTRGYSDIVGLLVEHGADVNMLIGTECDNKCTAIQAALYYISDYKLFKQIVNKLLLGNANLNIDKPGPLLYVCLQYNKINFAKYLVSVGADVKQRTVFNQSCFYKAFLSKNLEFMYMCVMAGFCLYDEPWINEYLQNPDFIQYTDYYVRRALSSSSSSNSDFETSSDDSLSETDLSRKTDQEINDLLNLDEYYFERFHRKKTSNDTNQKKQAELAKSIFKFIGYYHSNSLSLKELSRIAVRRQLLRKDSKLKYSVENELFLPKRLKSYLLMEEFNL
ncbi:unnamed protein product [Brachionus calyciflorus]|uniref:SOCS box domain-containing protein n=1 Tax=Brachionus calyciflorus TaxID=104777 RepID=A0A814DUC1_9BILA|nr:unnamed protein product [Brachionus calyciflorus]